MSTHLSQTSWSCDEITLFHLTTEEVSPRYVAWLNDKEINRYLECRFELQTIASTQSFVTQCLNNKDILFLGIRFHALANQHVGNIKLEINRRHAVGEVGILIGEKEVHGQGIASKAIQMIATIAREDLKLRKLTAGCYEHNRASEKAFLKAGFMIEGVRPAQLLCDGVPQSLILMGMLL